MRIKCTNVRHWHILYATINRDCRDGRHWDHSGEWHQYDEYDDQCDGVHHSGNRCASAILMLAAVLADRSCGRDTSNKAEAILPAPWATSSMSERCFPLIIPSATTQERSDSIAASTAMVNAFEAHFL